MKYTIKQLADIAGISIRTLHYYDEINLLKPSYIAKNNYRYYEDRELLRLQQILFYKELDLSLEQIKAILDTPNYNIALALSDQKSLLKLKKKRLNQLIKTIDKTLLKIKENKPMNDNELYEGFDSEEIKAYREEARERWGNTDAYKQSEERIKKMSKEEMKVLKDQMDEILKRIADNSEKGIESEVVQNMIGEYIEHLKHFYEPTLEIVEGLAAMYVADERFKKFFEKFKPGFAEFMRDAMLRFCKTKKDRL